MIEKRKLNVVITGGSAGLGRALALYAADLGHHIIIISRRAGQPDEELTSAGIHAISGDLSKKEDITRIGSQVLSHFESIDILINNASQLGAKTGQPLSMLVDTDCEVLEEVLATNVLGPFRLTKSLLGSMILRQQGLVVNISSDAAVSAYENFGAYSVSKAALDHMSRIWNEELKTSGVQFLAIDPGDMDTAMHRAAIPDADFDALYNPTCVAADLWSFLSAQVFENVRYTASQWRAS